MDSELYKAAMEGNIEVLRQHEDQLGHQLTPRNNTVLHVAAQFPDNTGCVKEILNLQPSLLPGINSKGETALHIAARLGCDNTIRELLDFARTPSPVDPESEAAVTKLLLWMTTFEEKDTALHEAVKNNSLGVVKLLVKEDPDLSDVANSYEETPLYLAAERRHLDIVSTILETCRKPAFGGPNGRTALHAAVIADCSSCVKKLLDKDQDLIKIGDSYGWTPLHFAARLNLVALTNQLLHTDKSIAYLAANEDDKMTAFHLAAKRGSFGMMQVFWLHCPDCSEMVNERGQNVLHIAIENENSDLIKKLLKSPFPISNMLHEKDTDGNTPLHLLATSRCSIPELIRHPAADKCAFNKKNQTPKDVIVSEHAYFYKEYIMELSKTNAPSGWRNIVSEDKDRLEKLRYLSKESKVKKNEEFPKAYDTTILVATLIATVTFAASFAVPGGFDSNQGPNQGMAVLVRNAAFRAFVISNTIALTFSISALLLLLFISYYQGYDDFFNKARIRFFLALNCLTVSLAAMMVSLITGSLAVLATSMGLAVAVCAIGCLGLLIFCVLHYKFYRDIFRQFIKYLFISFLLDISAAVRDQA
ncbi:ankyrin repeat-containing protein ITN1-like [Diospyros lotus]|uniref:ankyrin repeat-containing protein ITN1-like n=1 Tax=Diospyros lotus TaxID=55363 RepID=UPI0022594134|nr:ankyrin repeat-containing protein ITN1-like [Diospyros lotus]